MKRDCGPKGRDLVVTHFMVIWCPDHRARELSERFCTLDEAVTAALKKQKEIARYGNVRIYACDAQSYRNCIHSVHRGSDDRLIKTTDRTDEI